MADAGLARRFWRWVSAPLSMSWPGDLHSKGDAAMTCYCPLCGREVRHDSIETESGVLIEAGCECGAMIRADVRRHGDAVAAKVWASREPAPGPRLMPSSS